MLDELLIAANKVSSLLLPIVGVIVLVFLAVFLNKLVKLVDGLIKDLEKASETVNLVNKSIEKVQVPLDTACKISHTVDSVHDQSVEACKHVVEYASDNFDNVKEYINNIIPKKDDKENFPGGNL